MELTKNLKQPLEKVISTATSEDAQELSRKLCYGWIPSQPGITPEAMTPLIEAVSREPALSSFDNQVHWFMGSAPSMSYKGLARWLTFRALQVGSGQALKDLARYINEPEFEYQVITVLGGIKLDEKLKLENGFELMPYADLPNSPTKFQFERSLPPTTPLTKGPSFAIIQPPKLHPKIYLENNFESLTYTTLSDSPLKIPVGKGLLPTPPSPEDPSLTLNWKGLSSLSVLNQFSSIEWQQYQEAEDALLCLTLIGPSGVAFFCSWAEPAAWVPVSMSGSGYRGARTVEEVNDRYHLKPEEYESVQKIHKQFIELSEEKKEQLRIPLRRLNTAIRSRFIVDSAIDLGIALETIFLKENENRKVPIKINDRASRVFSEPKDELDSKAKKLKQLYKLRSDAAHRGKLKDHEQDKLLLEGYGLMAEAIRWRIQNPDVEW